MLCPSCNTPNRDNARFCKVCGKALAVEVVATASSHPVEQQSEAVQPEFEKTVASAPPQAQSPQTVADDEAATVYEPLETQSETSNSNGSEKTEADLAPTQFVKPGYISPQAPHERHRGNDESEQEQTQIAEPQDIADAPTILIAPKAEPEQVQVPDIADMPTVIMPPEQDAAEPQLDKTQYAGSVPPPPPPASQEPLDETLLATPLTENPYTEADATVVDTQAQPESTSERKESAEPEHELATDQSVAATATPEAEATEPSAQDASVAVAIAEQSATEQGEEESNVEQAAQDNTSPVEKNEPGAFAILEVGAKVQGRYEIAQVVSDAEDEHVYEVVDREGYQRCWNCDSEENAKDDEFCINCGAELLNAPYIMHEYPLNPQQKSEERVIQGNIVNTFVEQDRTYVIELPHELQSSSPNGLRLVAAADSDAGNTRRGDVNEDSTMALLLERVHESVSAPSGLFVVADGMGGHDNGQGASRMTIGLITERVVRELILPPLQTEKKGESVETFDEEAIVSILQGAIEEANTSLCHFNQREKSDMGSTLTGFMIVGDYAYIFNVGDSRTYMLRDEKLYQLTNDHSLVWQLVAGGLITQDDIYTHPQRNQIFRSIGDKLNVQVDLTKQQVHPGDILLSCSDGLWEMVRDPQIAEILKQAPDPQAAAANLIEAANANGGEDNISAVVVFVR